MFLMIINPLNYYFYPLTATLAELNILVDYWNFCTGLYLFLQLPDSQAVMAKPKIFRVVFRPNWTNTAQL
jgi:hypothetical protein